MCSSALISMFIVRMVKDMNDTTNRLIYEQQKICRALKQSCLINIERRIINKRQKRKKRRKIRKTIHIPYAFIFQNAFFSVSHAFIFSHEEFTFKIWIWIKYRNSFGALSVVAYIVYRIFVFFYLNIVYVVECLHLYLDYSSISYIFTFHWVLYYTCTL